jgi:hypothetical protein
LPGQATGYHWNPGHPSGPTRRRKKDIKLVFAPGGQGLFLKKPPLDPAKIFHMRTVNVPRFKTVFPIDTILFLLFLPIPALFQYPRGPISVSEVSDSTVPYVPCFLSDFVLHLILNKRNVIIIKSFYKDGMLFFCKLGLIILGLMMPVFAGAAQIDFNVKVVFLNYSQTGYSNGSFRYRPYVEIYDTRFNLIGRYLTTIFKDTDLSGIAKVRINLDPGKYIVRAAEYWNTKGSIRLRVSPYNSIVVSSKRWLRPYNYRLNIYGAIYSFRIIVKDNGVRKNGIPVYLTYYSKNGEMILYRQQIGSTGVHGPGEIRYEISLPNNASPMVVQVADRTNWYDDKKLPRGGSHWNIFEFDFRKSRHTNYSPYRPPTSTSGSRSSPTTLSPCQVALKALNDAAKRYRKNPTKKNHEQFKRANALYQDCLRKK